GTTAPLVSSVIRGRAAVTPQVAVNLNGSAAWVPLRTTARDLVEQLAFSNPLVWDVPNSRNAQFSMYRRAGAPPPGTQSLWFNPANAAVPDPAVYELPVTQSAMISGAG